MSRSKPLALAANNGRYRLPKGQHLVSSCSRVA
jgi:hypothetical protein